MSRSMRRVSAVGALVGAFALLAATAAPAAPAGPPSASIQSPKSGGVYAEGQWVATAFSCRDGTDGSGIYACYDSSGGESPDRLDTATPGRHRYIVTAISNDGQSATISITYTVLAPPKLSAVRVTLRAAGATSVRITLRYRDSRPGLSTIRVYRCTGARFSCTRLTPVGSFHHQDHRGKNRVRLSGRRHRSLLPGPYRIRIIAVYKGQRSNAVAGSFNAPYATPGRGFP